MNTCALAVDLGASSGRHILGRLENGSMVTEEIYRFSNGMEKKDGRLCWDTQALIGHIVEGMKRCGQAGYRPVSVGIDTWGVDYALLDGEGALAAPVTAYRDSRTALMPARLEARMAAPELYAHTGIAAQEYNTVYQLMTERAEPDRTLLFMPCYLSWLLCGVGRNEYTIASTSGLMDARTHTWDEAVLRAAGIPRAWLGEAPVPPGTRLGPLRPEIAREVGYDCDVILPACHDTGSAYLAVPAADEHAAILSSGTWSLLGMALDQPVLSEDARRAGFTNEGGWGGKIRFLRNIMGMWLVQSLRKAWDNRYSYAEMAQMALDGESYLPVFDPASPRFLAPERMEDEIRAALRERGAAEPACREELLYCVYHSLACCYRDAIADLRRLTGRRVTSLCVVGGGCQNRTLNQLTANETGLPVSAGPAEATALGNLTAQWLASGALENEEQARRTLARSVQPELFLPA